MHTITHNALNLNGKHPAIDAERKHTAEFGMWVFLASELLFFSGLFLGYFVYRYWYPEGFAAGSHESSVFLGCTNTLVLITSSFFMAAAVELVWKGQKKKGLLCMALVLLLGLVFLGIKSHEYLHKFHEGLYPGGLFAPEGPTPQGMEIYMSFYFVMTGLHALHLIVGVCILSVLFLQVWRAEQLSEPALRVEIFGLYWHFVDIIWIFLFPFMYLIGRH